jgi:hypothetical protein
MRKSVLLLLAVLIALPTANALAQPGPRLNVAIIKCTENNAEPGPITVLNRDATFELPATCAVTSACATCLRDLARDFNCRGGSVFTSNVEVVQQSNPLVGPTNSINKYVFACEGPVP